MLVLIDLRASNTHSSDTSDVYRLSCIILQGLIATEQPLQQSCLADTIRAALLQARLHCPQINPTPLKQPRTLRRTTVSFGLTTSRTVYGARRVKAEGLITSMKSSMSLSAFLATCVRESGSLIYNLGNTLSTVTASGAVLPVAARSSTARRNTSIM